MSTQDIFVGCVAVLLGLISLAMALRSEPAAYEPGPVRWLERRYGRMAARLCYVLVGLGVIALGAIVMLGVKFPWQV